MSHILYVMSMQPILESDSLPLHKKLGITNNTIIRATQLQTKMPFRMYIEAAWEIPDGRAQELESALHKPPAATATSPTRGRVELLHLTAADG